MINIINEYLINKKKINKCLTGYNLTYVDIRFFIHPFARLLIYIFDKLKLSPNTISILCFFISSLTVLYFFTNQISYSVFFFWLRTVLDYTDGGLARYSKKQSHFGAKLDLYLDCIFFLTIWLVFFLKLRNPNNYYFIFSVIFYFFFVNYYLSLKKKIYYVTIKKKFITKKILLGFSSWGQLEFWTLFTMFINCEKTNIIIFILITIHNIDLIIRYIEHDKEIFVKKN
jgi:phosphatidylglycerophosphate synthase